MADTEAAAPMGAGENNGVSQEQYEKLKADYEQKSRDLADARARTDVYEQKERTRIAAFQPAAKSFIEEIMKDADPETLADLSPLQTWSNEFATKADIMSQAPLARLVSCASAKLKRSRDEASANSQASESLGQTMKELESVTGERDALKQRLTEVSALAEERQNGLEKLQLELSRAGLMADKFDFSKLTSREKNADSAGAPETSTEVRAETSNASKKAVAATDHLLAEIFSRGGGSLRSLPSGTTHALLGNSGADVDLADVIRRA